jgi:RNA recognition motif-containing protein
MPSKDQKFEPRRQIFVGNLSYEATEKDLARALEDAGIGVFRVRVVTHQDTQRSRGFAFVDIDRDDLKEVSEIIEIVNAGITINGRVIHAAEAKERPRAPGGRLPPKPRGGRGHARSEFASPRSEFEDD